MTATADIITSEQKDALLVPNAALRFTPQTEGTPAASESGGITGALVPRRRRRGGGNQDTGASLATSGKATEYVKGAKWPPTPIQDTSGTSNGSPTVRTGGALKPRTAVIGVRRAGYDGRAGGGASH